MSLKKLSVSACLLAFIFSAAAAAEENTSATTQPAKAIQTQIYVSDDGATLYLIGPVNYGTYFDFIRVVRKHPKIKTIFLGSEGGTAIDGLLIANQVRRRGYNTHVSHYCASTCTQIFMAGTKRSADPLAKIGFHRSYLVDEKGMVLEEKVLAEGEEKTATTLTEAFGLDGDAALRLSYSRAGLTDAFITRVLAVPGSDMWHPEHAQLESDGVLNSPAPDLALAALRDGISIEQVQALVEDQPFWEAAQKYFPSTFDEAILEIWRARNVGVDADAAYWSARAPLADAAGRQASTAPDALIDRLAVHDGWSGALERNQGYPACAEASIHFVPPTAEKLGVIEAQEKLFIALLNGEKIAKPMAADKAVREYQKAWRDFDRFGLIEPENPRDPKQDCRVSFQINEAIARLEPKKRIKAYRALLSLPENASTP